MVALALFIGQAALAQSTIQEVSVLVSAVVRRSPAQVRLTWSSPTTQPATFTVYRRGKGERSWGPPLLVSTTAITSYDDNAVIVGVPYEYRVVRNSNMYSYDGHTFSGIEVPAIERRGTLVLVVDNTHAAYLAPELTQLQSDLVGDGWQVLRHDVTPTLSPTQVKAMIKADYLAAPTEVRAVFLLGHVAVPYSGNVVSDGHPDHAGAWPADVYYGDMLGTWTDNQVNTTTAYRPENRNIPGDGKFDQSTPPGGVQLQVGRADMSNLSFNYFNLSEANLLQRYLRKDHNFRHKLITVPERGLVQDSFFPFGGIGAANAGWGNFSALVGEANVSGVGNGGYFSTLRTQPYLLGYACGPGNFYGANRVGDVRQFAANPTYSVFNMLFGSYFGDWDNTDNFLRGAIAGDGYTLTNCWGNTIWSYHLMGLGETVGYATVASQNGGANNYTPEIWAALMGDPSLRLHPMAPPTAASATASAGRAALSWTVSLETVLGYYVYRAANPGGPFTRLTPQPVAATGYTDASPLPGTATYLVRAVALKTSPSGSYYNLSQGAFATFATATLPPATATWRGTQSTDWQTPANWSIGRVPTTADAVVVAGATPFAPTLGGQYPYEVNSLNLQDGAVLTVAAGSSLALPTAPVLLPGSGPLTTLALAASAPGGQPGGQLLVQDRAAANSLRMVAGTALTVADGAELTLAGNLTHQGGAVTFAPLGRLVFTHGGGSAGYGHTLAGPAATTAGIVVLADPRDALTLAAPLAVSTRIENQGTVVTNNQLTLLAGPGQQAILAPVMPALQRTATLGTYTGNLTVQVCIDGSRNAGLGYRHLAAPVDGTTVAGLATSTFTPVTNRLYNTVGNSVQPFPTVFRYDEAAIGSGTPGPVGFDQGWIAPYDGLEPLFPGFGYTANMPANTTLNFNGQAFTQSNLVFDRSWGMQAAGGWQFFGNPYAAPLSWDRLAAEADLRLIQLNPALYVFKSSGQYAGAYASYLPGVGGAPGIGINGGTGVVPVGQAFFVRVVAPNTSGRITYSINDVLGTTDGRTVQRPAADLRPRLVLALRDATGTLAHQTAVYFQAGATAGADARLDAPLLPGAGQTLTLATRVAGNDFSINGLPPLAGTEVRVPLLLRATVAGRYELAVETLAHLPTPYHAYLHDATANTYTDLALTSVVGLALPANTRVASRYTLVFSPQARVLATAPAALAALASLYPNPAHGTATLRLPPALQLPKGTTAVLLNTLGQVVRRISYPPGPTEIDLPLAGLAPGIYTVQARTTAGTINQRLVVE